ncbi:hypothetical protein BDZ45DRAFT_264056 [Acephala macrosclerotiorum]|nr:hypothetical protein BDZ45DRAFT_264056 [Acephala macrosclerotiorum]
MNQFLVELHNRFPAEMQAFHRHSMLRPDRSQWLMDQNAGLLTFMRQKSGPPLPIFTSITTCGKLVVSELTQLSQRGIGELNSRILSMNVLPALDGFAFNQVTGGIVNQDCPRRCDEAVLRAEGPGKGTLEAP